MTFDEQVDAMLACLPRRHRIVFLAGIRFAQGHAEHGDKLFLKTITELGRDSREERSDDYTYSKRMKYLKWVLRLERLKQLIHRE